MAIKKVNQYLTPRMIISYKGYPVMIREVGKHDIFMWDLIINGQFYSGHLVMAPKKGSNKLTKDELNEVVKMCYAGAAATIDNFLGIKMSDTDEQIIKQFEAARKMVESQEKPKEKEDKVIKP